MIIAIVTVAIVAVVALGLSVLLVLAVARESDRLTVTTSVCRLLDRRLQSVEGALVGAMLGAAFTNSNKH